jgi:hypothetical protein
MKSLHDSTLQFFLENQEWTLPKAWILGKPTNGQVIPYHDIFKKLQEYCLGKKKRKEKQSSIK